MIIKKKKNLEYKIKMTTTTKPNTLPPDPTPGLDNCNGPLSCLSYTFANF